MKPIEHYREAERLLREVGRSTMGVNVSVLLAAAQVHATLAVAGSQLRSLAAEEDGQT